MSAALSDIVSFLNQELRTAEIVDYPGAINGLQLANSGTVPRIVAAVDASLPVIEAAAAAGAGLLIVHHGMFWQGAQPITGALHRKLKSAMEADLAIYSSHLRDFTTGTASDNTDGSGRFRSRGAEMHRAFHGLPEACRKGVSIPIP